MQGKDIMSQNVEIIRPDASLKEAAEKMSQRDIGPLPACDGERLIGMVTDRDITVREVAKGYDPKTTLVREVMTSEVVYCFKGEAHETFRKALGVGDTARRGLARRLSNTDGATGLRRWRAERSGKGKIGYSHPSP